MDHALTLPAPWPNPLADVIRWAFGVATKLTNKGKAKFAEQVKVVEGGTPPKYLAMGVGAHGAAREAAATDTALSTEVETRAIGTMTNVTTTITNDTYQVVGTQTALATREVDEMGVFDAASTGNMFLSATLNTISLANGDSVTWTVKVQQS